MQVYETRTPDEWAKYRRRQFLHCETCQRMTPARYKRTGKPVFCSGQCREFWFPKHNRQRYLDTYDPDRERSKYLRQKADNNGRVPRYKYVHEYPDFQPRLLQCMTCQRMFEPSSLRRYAFCSTQCRMWMSNRWNGSCAWSAKRTMGARNCVTCSAPLTGRHGSTRYCTPKCKRSKSKRCGQVSKALQAQVIARDGWWCHICGDLINPNLDRLDRMAMTMDHLIPVALGGTDDAGNLRPAHRACNSRRGTKPVSRSAW